MITYPFQIFSMFQFKLSCVHMIVLISKESYLIHFVITKTMYEQVTDDGCY